MTSFSRNFLLVLVLSSFVLFAQDSPVGQLTYKGPQQQFKSITGDIQYTNNALPSNGSTSGNSRAPQGSQRYIRTVYLITAAELQAAGVPSSTNFTSIGFVYAAAQNIATTGAFKVYLKNTSDAAFGLTSTTWTDGATGIIDAMTLVDSSSITIPASLAPSDHALSNPGAFTYTGGGLYIAWEYQNPSGTLSTGNTALCNTNLIGGLKNGFSTTTLPASVGTASNYRPATRLGYAITNDAGVLAVYTLGKLPLLFGAPHKVSAVVVNAGDNDLTSIACTLKVTGANTFTNVKTVTNLTVGGIANVTFDGFTPTAAGVDTITVTLAADNNALNNTYVTTQEVNNNYVFAYSDGSTNIGNALGIGANTEGSFVAKLYVNGHAKLNSVKAFIYNASTSVAVGKILRGIIYDKSWNVLAQSDDYTIQAADANTYVTFNFPVPPAVTNDSVYVGLWQSSSATAYYPMGLQTEVPTRPGTFYAYSGGVAEDIAPYDFGKYMIEANFAQNPYAKLLFAETFDEYNDANLAGQGSWVKFGSGPEPVVGSTSPLNYLDYVNAGGKYMNFATNSGTTSRLYKDAADTSFSMTVPGTVAYASLLLKLNTTYTTATGYFFSLGCAPATNNYYAKLFAQRVTDTTYYLGVSKSSNTAAFSTKLLKNGETNLVVIRYNVNNTALSQSGNTCYMWINPTGTSEPDTATADAKVYAGQQDYTSTTISSILWHNRGTSNPLGSIDGIRLAVSPNSSAAAWLELNPFIIPVELSSFSSSVVDGKVVLTWITATETNNSGFDVQRKAAGENSWTNLGFVKGQGTSTSPKVYSFTDQNTNSGKYSYRLKQIDDNGTFKYSNVVNAEIGLPESFSLSQNYPNPFNPSTKIEYQVPSDSRVKIELYNIAGQKIADLVDADQSAGFYSLSVNANSFRNIASGVYIYKMTAVEKMSGKIFANTKKMMLMK